MCIVIMFIGNLTYVLGGAINLNIIGKYPNRFIMNVVYTGIGGTQAGKMTVWGYTSNCGTHPQASLANVWPIIRSMTHVGMYILFPL